MVDKIIELIIEYFGVSVFLFFAIIVGLVVLAYNLGKKKEELDNLPCDEHKASLDEHRKNIQSLLSDVAEIKGSMTNIQQSITIIQQTLMTSPVPANRSYSPSRASNYSQKKSPRKLNENGLNLFNDVGGQKFIDDNKEFLFGEIDKCNPKTAYDVEVSALSVLRINQNNDIYDGIKNWVYVEPSRTIIDEKGEKKTVDATLEDVLFVISLPLRDAYLETHPKLIPKEEK